MNNTHKLSLLAAIFININIILGTGFFINTVVLTTKAGSLSPLTYLLVAALILPLIMSMGRLMSLTNGSGTFYDFGAYISPFFGFISSWSYFTGKLCSSVLGIHVCLSFLQQILPALGAIPLLALDSMALILFTGLTMLNMQLGKQIQFSFICLKVIPIIFVVLSGLYLWNGAYFTPESMIWSGVPLSVPLVLYVFTGFEASCSLSTHIENSEVNGPRAIYISYALAVAIVFAYQLFFYASLGMYLGTLQDGYLAMFPALVKAFETQVVPLKTSALVLFHIAIASSSLGSAYGILYSNTWNLYTLAQNHHTFMPKILTRLNAQGIPFACSIAEGLLCFLYLGITRGYQIPLQQVASFGATIAYTVSSLALLVVLYRKRRALYVPILGIISCLLLLSSFVWSVVVQGPSLLLATFIGLLIAGSAMFYYAHPPKGPIASYDKI